MKSKYSLAAHLILHDGRARLFTFSAIASAIIHAIFSICETIIIAIVAAGLLGYMEVNVGTVATSSWLMGLIAYGHWLIPFFVFVYCMSYISFGFLHYCVQHLGARIGVLLFTTRSKDSNILATQTGNGELINDIGVEITRLSQQVLPPMATCFAKALNILALVAYSLYLSTEATILVALIFSSAYLFIWLLMRKSTRGLSAKVALLLNRRMNFLSDYVKGYKFFWVSKSYLEVTKRLERIFKEYASSQARVALNAFAPKASIEMIAICLFGFYVLTSNSVGSAPLSLSFYELSQLGAITLKLMPSFSSCFGAFVIIKANNSAWDIFSRNGNSIYKKWPAETEYDKNVFPVYIDLPSGFSRQNVTISTPQIILFEGVSGSGKTTFFDGLIGLRNTKALVKSKALEIVNCRNLFAYVPQENFVFEGTIAENLFWDEERNINDLKKVWKACGLDSLSLDVFNPSFYIYPQKISGGQKQRLAIARALLEEKVILILDESFAGIDTESAIKILNATKNDFGHTIFMTSHNEAIKNYADMVVKVRKP